MQEASGLQLWIGQPSFLGNTPEPGLLGKHIDDTRDRMVKAGMDVSPEHTFYGAHSLGIVWLQDWYVKNDCAGQVLTSGFISRKYNYPAFKYPVRTLTLGGSLDGLARVTRTIAESYYRQIELAKQGEWFPVAVIKGMNHFQWGSGTPSEPQQKRDLQAKMSDEKARESAAALIVDWLDQLVGHGGKAVAKAVAETGIFVAPILAAYSLEGSRHFNSPGQIGGPGRKSACVRGKCTNSSEWTIRAQELIAGDLGDASFSARNMFVDAESSPPFGDNHNPMISNNTSNGKLIVLTTTFLQCRWSLGDEQDTGAIYTSASEIAASSRRVSACRTMRWATRASPSQSTTPTSARWPTRPPTSRRSTMPMPRRARATSSTDSSSRLAQTWTSKEARSSSTLSRDSRT
jgi:hypothetical protein